MGKAQHQGREKMKKRENIACSPLKQGLLSDCKYNLKMHRGLKKTHLLWFAMGWNSHQFSRKCFLLYKGEYWFRGGLSMLLYVLLHRHTDTILWQVWLLLSHLLGRQKRGTGSSLTKQTTIPTTASSCFQFTCYSFWPSWIHHLITSLCPSPGLRSALSWHHLFSLSCVIA